MIVVKIELHSAITREISEIGRMYIANDGTGTPERGDYKVAVCRKGSKNAPRELFADDDPHREAYPKAARAGEVKNYPRLSANVWRLIARALHATFPEERVGKSTDGVTLDAEVVKGLARFAQWLRGSAE